MRVIEVSIFCVLTVSACDTRDYLERGIHFPGTSLSSSVTSAASKIASILLLVLGVVDTDSWVYSYFLFLDHPNSSSTAVTSNPSLRMIQHLTHVCCESGAHLGVIKCYKARRKKLQLTSEKKQEICVRLCFFSSLTFEAAENLNFFVVPKVKSRTTRRLCTMHAGERVIHHTS